jgi:putative oxidoreductase
MKVINFLLRLGLGGFFIYAGVEKIIDPAGFSQNIGNYQMVRHDWLNLMAITLPWTEVVAGLLLITGPWKRASAVAIAFMLVVFLVAIASAMHRGLNINCGCTGTVGGTKVGFQKLAEDTAMLAVAVWLIFREKD